MQSIITPLIPFVKPQFERIRRDVSRGWGESPNSGARAKRGNRVTRSLASGIKKSNGSCELRVASCELLGYGSVNGLKCVLLHSSFATIQVGQWAVVSEDSPAWFKRRLQLRVAGVAARGVPLSSFAPRKHALSRSERQLDFNASSCYPRNTQSEPCPDCSPSAVGHEVIHDLRFLRRSDGGSVSRHHLVDHFGPFLAGEGGLVGHEPR
jgi:hypothetical protein